jgi:hypothetical protein
LEGKLIASQRNDFKSGLNTFIINTQQLSSGAYILKLNTTRAQLSIPFVKR